MPTTWRQERLADESSPKPILSRRASLRIDVTLVWHLALRSVRVPLVTWLWLGDVTPTLNFTPVARVKGQNRKKHDVLALATAGFKGAPTPFILY